MTTQRRNVVVDTTYDERIWKSGVGSRKSEVGRRRRRRCCCRVVRRRRRRWGGSEYDAAVMRYVRVAQRG